MRRETKAPRIRKGELKTEGNLIPWRVEMLNSRYAPGSILRVSLKNFVTYTSAEFYPGPNLNLIIGPNGSGKSTIVCAICIGLGFKPEVLGRATSPADFVQHGKDMAEIEIELAAENDESVVIKRRIKRDKNQSTYYINGSTNFYCINARKARHSRQSTRAHAIVQHPDRQFMVLPSFVVLIQSISSPR